MNENHMFSPAGPQAEELCSGSLTGFANSLTVWLNKPHVVNRRLCGSRLEYCQVIEKQHVTANCLASIVQKHSYGLNGYPIHEFLPWLARSNGTENYVQVHSNGENLITVDSLADMSDNEVAVIIRQMLPKQPERHSNMPELVVYDKSERSCDFIPLQLSSSDELKKDSISEVAYKFVFKDIPQKRICLYANTSDCSPDSERKLSLTWIQSQLLQKLARWSEQPSLRTGLTSLCLISLEDYSRLYSELKNKYGIPLAKNWPEKTSAQKYVFEDVAIATYLLLLWEDDRTKKGLTQKQSFVDLGCGNGLLVHILASEGHPGYGIDIRRRKIWDLYGPETVLKETSITPSSEHLFPDCDWLIGNHSDELTPWIPVIASRSSYSCSYFVLPCCFWDFNAKYSFNKAFEESSEDVGKYRLYLDFVKTVGEKCGFMVEEDMLRIPSTKRVCFIGRGRTYDPSNEQDIDQQRQNYIGARCDAENDTDKSDTAEASTKTWVSEFTPRSKSELTRNCVTVKKETKDHVIKTVFDNLITCDDGEVKVKHDGKPWRKGGKLSVSDAVGLFEKDLLLELKCECGGLQTLLRNSCHIFQVSGGQVQLRDFTLDDPFEGRKKKTSETDVKDFLKTTLCWFFENHPDGCPKESVNCKYAHGLTELRPRPVKTDLKRDTLH